MSEFTRLFKRFDKILQAQFIRTFCSSSGENVRNASTANRFAFAGILHILRACGPGAEPAPLPPRPPSASDRTPAPCERRGRPCLAGSVPHASHYGSEVSQTKEEVELPLT